MDLDLSNLSWEQKALIGIGAIVLIILIYAYWPSGSSSGAIDNNTTVVDNAPVTDNNPKYSPVNQQSSSGNESTDTNDNTQLDTNTDTNNVNNDTNQETKQITSMQAKEIAAQEGLTAGSPRSGTFKQGNENVQVWIVPLSENNVIIREVYIDKNTGTILATKELNTASRDTGNNTMI